MTDGVHRIYSREYCVMIDAVQIVYAQGMGSIAFIDEIWSTYYLLLKEGVDIIYTWWMLLLLSSFSL